MAYVDPTYSLTQKGFSNYQTACFTQEALDDPVRIARNNWVARHANLSDSSDIIDSIDVDMIDADQDDHKLEIYIVLDTNILINNLVVLKQVVAGIETSNTNVVLLVPGIVVSELDYQKTSSRDIAIASRKASDWLASEIGNSRGYVRGQAYTQTMLPSKDWRQRCGLSNDELILDCCKYFGHVKRKDVLLCTSDNNLAVQACSNAANIFLRDVGGVVRPPREHWDWIQLLDRAIPGFGKSSAASVYASSLSHRGRGGQGYPLSTHLAPSVHNNASEVDDAIMEIDVDESLSCDTRARPLPRDRRDELHKQIVLQLTPQIRRLTGEASKLQEHRRTRESIHSPDNAKYTGNLPSEYDWSRIWTVRECLKFVAKISPPQRRSWIFTEGEASSLADFLGLPGEKGARPGREWSRHDWARELATVRQLAEDFRFVDLDSRRMAEYEYKVRAAFAATS